MIDNFDIIKNKLLTFPESNLDRYIVHILRRKKDISQGVLNELGSNEAQRLIKTYYIDSVDYFERKIPAIKELCNSNNARAYLIVQPKDNFECLINLGKKIFDTIQNRNYSVKPEHLLRQAYCEHHKTRLKRWIIDLDFEEMTEYCHSINFGGTSYWTKTWTVQEVKDLIIEELREIQKLELNKYPRKYTTWLEDQVYEVKTKHGIHIITPPFNLQSAQKKCGLMFEGRQKFTEQILSGGPNKYGYKFHELTGWLHKDGMTPIYIP
jgi:hypothetical protein